MRRKALNRVVVFWRAQQFCLLILILTVGLAPFAAEAQTAAKMYRIGVLTIAGPTDTPPPPPENWEGFLQGLREGGYIEGQNVAFELRSAGGRPERFSELAADLVRLKVDLIFARGPEAVRAAKSATQLSTLPIVAIDLTPSRLDSWRVSPNQAETCTAFETATRVPEPS